MVKTANPYDPKWNTLLTIYNSDALEDELIRFLNCFDTDGLFYSDAVVYHQGRYHSFRNNIIHDFSGNDGQLKAM